MTTSFEKVQRIVLRGTLWSVAQHLVLDFSGAASPSKFLEELREGKHWPVGASPAETKRPDLQVSLGFSRYGLERLPLTPQILSCFFLKSPAFFAGAPLRANSELGASGRNAPERWDPAFEFPTLHAVLSVHAGSEDNLTGEVSEICKIAAANSVGIKQLPLARKLPKPGEKTAPVDEQYVHFDYRDGLSRVGIKGWKNKDQLGNYSSISMHEPGEFLLGHAQDCGANPWLASPQGEVWPQEWRDFFRDGSFGVLHQIQQDVTAFETFIKQAHDSLGIDPMVLKAKLCGRHPEGQSLAVAAEAIKPDNPFPDFNYHDDPEGFRCPFGSHMRRMNPRDTSMVEASRTRALLRRGMPYGEPGADDVGLIAQFFCASIEDQFEHLVGQWADRVPLGSKDGGGARDPLAGAHQPGDGVFEIPREGDDPLLVTGFRAFTRNRGTAYLFYPSLSALETMVPREQAKSAAGTLVEEQPA